MTKRITTKTNIEKEMILKAVAINEKNEDSFIVGHFYKVENINKNIAYNPGIKLNGYWYAQWELIDYFEIVDSLDDIDDLKEKAFLIKTYAEELKELAEYKHCAYEQLIEEAINSIHHLEKHKLYYPELKFISEKMNIEMVEQCSCCGDILLPDDECYSDSLNGNGNSVLCDHCSIMNEETDNYEKYVNQDIIEKITGLKFSAHIGNVGSKIEEFNQYIKENKLNFSVFDDDLENSTTFLDFIQERTEWNICDCCGMIEISKDLIWNSDEVYDEDYQNFRFLRATSIPSEAFCKGCLDLAGEIAKPNLETITSRIIENNLIFRVGEFVLLENVEWDNKPKINNNLIAKISSINKDKKTYTLEEYGDVEFEEDEFYDVVNEAYLMEYVNFIADEHSELNGEVDEWTSPNHEGIVDINYAFENFGYKNEFIEYLKSKDLPYGRFLESSFKNNTQYKVGDLVTVDEEMIDSSKDVTFLENLLGRILIIEEVTDEYKHPQVPTYKCIDFETKEVINSNILPDKYFPFVDSDLKKFAELKKDK